MSSAPRCPSPFFMSRQASRKSPIPKHEYSGWAAPKYETFSAGLTDGTNGFSPQRVSAMRSVSEILPPKWTWTRYFPSTIAIA